MDIVIYKWACNFYLTNTFNFVNDTLVSYDIVRKYGKENVILTGHSLGGSEAQILGAKYGVETVTFAAYGTKYLSGMEINYTDNITNYGNAQDGVYVMNITKEVFELLQKHIGEFSIKALNVTGVKLEFFKKYTSFLRQGENIKFNSKSFIQTFRPYLQFYKSLDTYAKTTYKFDNPSTAKFRDALANAKDPEKTFFEVTATALI